MHPLVRLALLATLLAGCSESGPQVLVTLEGDISPRVIAFRVTGHAGEAPKPSSLQNNPIQKRFTSFLVQLPPNPQGTLHLQVDGLRQGGCAIASGMMDTPVETAVRDGVTISLRTVPEECKLNLEISGAGTVRCIALEPSAGASLDDSCDREFALGEKIRLRPEPAADSAFLGWSDACQGRADCDLVIREQPTSAQARFYPTRFCTQQGLCWESPLPTGAGFLGLWSSPEGELWAVGQEGVILRRQGGAFYPFTNANSQQRKDVFAPLNAVWGSSKDDVWIVGDCRTVLHWNGTRLDTMQEDMNCTSQRGWRSVWGRSAKDVWMVGLSGAIQHWNGSSFQTVTPPIATNLFGVDGLSDGRVVIVGDKSTLLVGNEAGFTQLPGLVSDLVLTAVREQDQAIWAVGEKGTIVRADLIGGGVELEQISPARSLFALYAAGNALWAFGAGGTALLRTSAAAGWRVVPTRAQTLGALTAAAGISADDFWVVGTGGDRVHWNGAYFVNERGDTPSVFTRIRGLSSTNLWLGSFGELYRRSNGSIYKTNLSVENLYGILPLSGSEALLGLSAGLAHYRFESGTLSYVCEDSGLIQLNALDSSDSSYAYGVGVGGQILECINASGQPDKPWTKQLYQPMDPKQALTYNAVWAAGLRNVFLVGEGTKISRFYVNGGQAMADVRPLLTDPSLINSTKEFLAIHGSSPQNIWVGGPDGLLVFVYYTETAFTTQVILTRKDLIVQPEVNPAQPLRIRGVWARQEDDGKGNITLREVWAVGDAGLLVRLRLVEGKPIERTLFASGTSTTLYSVWGFGADNVWAAGLLGTVLHYDPKVLQAH